MTVGRLLIDHGDLIDADLHQIYGIDTADPAVLDGRPWQWFLTRVQGLLTCESRLHRKLAPPEQTPQVPTVPNVPRR